MLDSSPPSFVIDHRDAKFYLLSISARISCKLLEELLPFITWDPRFRERKTSKQTPAFAGESESSDFPIE